MKHNQVNRPLVADRQVEHAELRVELTEQGISTTYRLIAKSVRQVRKANVSDTENGSEEAVIH